MSKKIGRSKPSMEKASEESTELKYVKIEINEQQRLVPVVQFAFHDRVPDGCHDMAEIDDDCIPGSYFGDDIWDEGIGCNVQPVSNTVRVLIRPDVSKQEAINTLIKIIGLINIDELDWGQETDNYLNHWKAQIAEKKRKDAVRSAA